MRIHRNAKKVAWQSDRSLLLVLLGGTFIGLSLLCTALFERGTGSVHDDNSFDIVTLIHHDDLSVFLQYGLASWQHFFAKENTHIFIVGTPKAIDRLQHMKEQASNNFRPTRSSIYTINWDPIVLVSQDEYPFTLKDVSEGSTRGPKEKPTWNYQQLLKLYAYEVLSTRVERAGEPTLQERFLVIDSDNVALQHHDFMYNGKPVFNIASATSGAFINDCRIKHRFIEELFDGDIEPAFDDNEGVEFTSITHHMMFNGRILREILSGIRSKHDGKAAWLALINLEEGYVSEYELYLAWMMAFHRDALYIQQTAYMNSGRSDAPYLEWVRYKHDDIVYLTKHDDWTDPNLRCCVNTNWQRPRMSSPAFPGCGCCGEDNDACHNFHAESFKITCDTIGFASCQQDAQGRMFFEDEASWSSSGDEDETEGSNEVSSGDESEEEGFNRESDEDSNEKAETE